MHIVLTVCSGLILCLSAWLMLRTLGYHDAVAEMQLAIERVCGKLSGERARVTVNEREIEALRRELRKLAGKFYAQQREIVEEAADAQDDADALQELLPVCQNWLDAKQLGPRSEAAKCECHYCLGQRAERARLRAELVPRTVQGQAELARLNAGKP